MSTSPEKPHVLIVGAGIGGLLLGNLLEKSNVPYTIFERAAAVKALGMYIQYCATSQVLWNRETWRNESYGEIHNGASL